MMTPDDPNYDPLLDGPSTTSQKPKRTAADDMALTAAMMSMESDVELPGRIRASSVTGNLIGLDLNATFIKSVEVPQESTLQEITDKANAYKQGLRQSVNNSIRHARKFDNREFTMESAMTMFPSGRVFIQVAVTRIA